MIASRRCPNLTANETVQALFVIRRENQFYLWRGSLDEGCDWAGSRRYHYRAGQGGKIFRKNIGGTHKQRAASDNQHIAKIDSWRRSGVIERGKYASARPSSKVSCLCSKGTGTNI